jgi:hypothetical protein
MLVAEGHAPDSAVAFLTSATLPAVVLMLLKPDASCAGRELTPFWLPAPRTR